MGLDDRRRRRRRRGGRRPSLGLAEQVADQRVLVDDGRRRRCPGDGRSRRPAAGPWRAASGGGRSAAARPRRGSAGPGSPAARGRRRIDGLVEAVHDTRRDGVQAVGLAADHDGGDHEHDDRRDDREHPRRPAPSASVEGRRGTGTRTWSARPAPPCDRRSRGGSRTRTEASAATALGDLDRSADNGPPTHIETDVGDHPLEAAPSEEPHVASVEDAATVVVEAADRNADHGGTSGRSSGRSRGSCRRRRAGRSVRTTAGTARRVCSSTSAATIVSKPPPISAGRPLLRSASKKASSRSPTFSCLTRSTPVTWCPSSRTSVAEAPIRAAEVEDPTWWRVGAGGRAGGRVTTCR